MLINNIVKSNAYYKIINKLNNLHKMPYTLYELHFNGVLNELNYLFESADIIRDSKEYINYNFHIWIMWWQGFDNAPRIVKNNYRRLANLFGKRVIFLSKNNINIYTNIDKKLWEKLEIGIIDYTHWSDIVRFNVLLNNGGLWIDSTILVSQKAKEFILSQVSQSFFSISCNDYRYISGGKWIIGFIGGKPHEPLFEYLNNFYKLYYENYSKMIDYLLTDFAIFYYYSNHSDFKNKVDNLTNEWHPYFFSEHYLDSDVSKYKKLFTT